MSLKKASGFCQSVTICLSEELPPMQSHRWGATCVVALGCLYVLGGVGLGVSQHCHGSYPTATSRLQH